MVKGAKCFTLFYSGLLKQSRPGYNEAFLELFSHPPDRRLCVIFVLKEYLSRTEKFRGNCQNLFTSYVKPFGPVSRETISRWLKTVMSSSGIHHIVLDQQLFLRLIRMLFQLKKKHAKSRLD
jgi:hypothetical protein